MYKKLFLLSLVVTLLFVFVGSSSFAGRTDGLLRAFDAIGDAIGFVAPLPKTGVTTSYYDNDDGYLQMGITSPDPRFTDNEDDTVTDNLTGLIWTKDAYLFEDGGTWSVALSLCDKCSEGGYTDWRLPNVRELHSLMDYSMVDPVLPEGHPFDGVQKDGDAYDGWYWSSTPETPGDGGEISAWFVNLGSGNIDGHDENDTGNVWCVRGGQ